LYTIIQRMLVAALIVLLYTCLQAFLALILQAALLLSTDLKDDGGWWTALHIFAVLAAANAAADPLNDEEKPRLSQGG
jgi:type IV secretory pathway VirB6-like protein